MLSKDLEWASVSVEDLLLGNVVGRSLHRVFEIKRYIMKDVRCPVSGYLSPQGPRIKNLEGISLPGLFEKKG
jgi:hypothetical protein